MDDNKHLPDSKRVVFLEGELKRLQKELAKKTREIEVEKALEKVRVKALDMRNSSELSETSTILFQQLKELKIDAVRSGVGIFDDENDAIELWVTSISPNGKLFFVLDYINTGVHVVFENIIEARKSQKLFALTKLEGKDLLHYYKTMSTYAAISRERDNPLTEFYYSFFFSAGTINVVTNEALTQEEEEIMLRLANVFGLLYTRFLDLKKMEEQAILINEEKNVLETTLNNLKATQSQLIQSEKMASLGELTAGIAHEIQNPLNFVNNFSEINAELVDELKTELSYGNIQSAIEIADTLKDNEEKINHHGKRADSIVKGMLQHSRTSSGQKEPTDINSLTDEYLRLAYHGLRAKNKSFHTIIKTEFDRGIGKINVNPQDMGRVILNLINNAFYAVNEKAKQDLNVRRDDVTEQRFEPTVTVKTAGTNGKIEIIIKDNGIGIPQKILDKVLQPFFTTKPTGQGTGLGLSLAYDVITKGHGGELQINSVENEGSEFIVTLPVQPD